MKEDRYITLKQQRQYTNARMKMADSTALHPASIYCVGKNYEDHAREMLAWERAPHERHSGYTPLKEPLIFLKPGAALEHGNWTTIPVFDGRPVSAEMHYEAELVLLIGKKCESVSRNEAASCIAGYGVGLDMTLRDVQQESRKEGHPWLKSKGFRHSALVSGIVPARDTGSYRNLEFRLELNGREVQHGRAADMLFTPAELISYISSLYPLITGDLIFTGTPSGVGPVGKGDRLVATLSRITDRESSETLARLDADVR
ncbi:fumarylacetoacetate hydrolase family protein [Prosthecochloris sp. HL-130-GSB]|uniref:fumarylacetoacetate hydrolase family protein n=1 Tax=Prosthecochloris sp. HL-130-GSB TaxID=1974213 RepID=UPI001E537305|nr:fumarylacetoacetate hydrolase family protein [Prosthecochloris sp. HL-130-GSB]